MKQIIFTTLMLLSSVIFSKTLKTAYQASYPKYYKIDKKMQGLCIELMKAVDSELKNISFENKIGFLPFKRLQKELESGSIDIFFCIAKNSKREKLYFFNELPLYDVNHILAIRKDDNIDITTINSIQDLVGKGAVLTNSNTATERLLKKVPGLSLYSAKNLEVNINKLLKKRGRFIYFHDIGLASIIRSKFQDKNIKLIHKSFKKYSHFIAFSKQVKNSTINIINSAVKKLKENGTFDKILKSYRCDL